MKKVFILLFLISASAVMAQLPKKRLVVGFIPFTGDGLVLGTQQNNFISRHLYNLVTTEFINSHRFTVIELNAFDLTKIELERQKGEGSMYTEIKRQGKALSADVLVFGSISVITYSKTTKGEYSVNASYSLKYIDVETGEVKHAKLLDGKQGNGELKAAASSTVINMKLSKASTSDDQKIALEATKSFLNNTDGNLDKSVKNAFDNTKGDITKWLKDIFPVTMAIKDVQKGDPSLKEDSTRYYIVFDGGKADGVPEKMNKVKLYFIQIKMAMDSTKTIRDIPLYELKVESVQETVTVCSIKIKDADKPEGKDKTVKLTLEERIRRDFKLLKGVDASSEGLLSIIPKF